MNSHYIDLLQKAIHMPIGREDALALFRGAGEGQQELDMLCQTARQVRKIETGDRFRLTGGISSVLPCHLKPLCLYCPYWREERQVVPLEAVIEGAEYFKKEGIREFHLSGGTTLGSDGGDVLRLVEGIWNAGIRDMEITINCGAAMSVETMRRLKNMGVVKVGAVFETASPEVFARLKPGDSMRAKEQFAWDIREAGLSMHSGIMAGLGPAQSRYEGYVETLFYLKQFPHMVSLYISKFRPDPSIPMRDHPQCSLDEACMLVAVTRLVLRKTEIRIAAGWSGQESVQGILAGGGGELCALMLNHRAGYWNRTETEERVQPEYAFSDTREEKCRMAEQMGLVSAWKGTGDHGGRC